MIALGDVPGDELGLLQPLAEIGQNKNAHGVTLKEYSPRRHRVHGGFIFLCVLRVSVVKITGRPARGAPLPGYGPRSADNVARAAAAASLCPSRRPARSVPIATRARARRSWLRSRRR